MFPLALSIWAVILSGQPSYAQGYVGAQTCRTCHRSQFDRHQTTGHARSLSKPSAAGLPLDQQPRRGAVQFRYADGPFRIHAQDATDSIDLPVDWAFGGGAQATTFVSRISKEWYLEHYLSYYPKLGRFAPTPGHAELATPKSLRDAVGLVYPALDPKSGIAGCFECHSTGPILREGEIHPTESGVMCEGCHNAGSAHVASSAPMDIRNPRALTPVALNTMCGRCHRPPASTGEVIDWNYTWNLRHQPIYLSQSQCFRQGKLSCLTCHPAHEPLQANTARQREICLSCHSQKQQRKPSPRCATNCVECHMPRVSPQAGLIFHNHWIGVYPNGTFLKPRR